MAVSVNLSNFKAEVLDAATPVLVDFFATWCGPCKMMSPVVDSLYLESDGKYKVCKVDIDESEELARTYNVHSVPTFIVFNGGKEIQRTVGGTTKENLLGMLEIR